jgi:hypothetical protein
MLRPIAAAAVLMFASTSLVNAQTIYAPVQYQYGTGEHRYYYGGSDPAVFERAEQKRCFDELTDVPCASERYTHAYVHRRLVGRLERVYSDCAPHVNARAYGYLPVDAANEASRNVPLYFRKADLLHAGVVQPDGSVVVPAQARPATGVLGVERRATTRPVVRPRAILILPRETKQPSDKLQVSAAR